MRVEDGERHGAVLGDNGDGGGDEDVEITGADAVTGVVEKDRTARRHRRGYKSSDSHLEKVAWNPAWKSNGLGGEDKRADGARGRSGLRR